MNSLMTPSIPCGYPPPHDPSKVAVFTVSDDWCCDDLLDCYGSLDEVLEVIKGLVREDVPDYDDLTAEAVARQILDVRLQDGIYRHQVPFYSSGVKRELKQKGIPVTKADELRASLPHFSDRFNDLLRTRSIRDVAVDIAASVELDDAYRGNYAGYPASLVSRILRELVEQGELSCAKSVQR